MEKASTQTPWPDAGCCLLFGLVYWAHAGVNPNHATSYDSDQYLSLAQQILKANWLPTIAEPNALGRPFNPYGPGYSYAIALASLGGIIPLLWASKLLNFGLIALGMIRLGRLEGFRAWAWLPVLSAQFLLLSTHTWSEGMLLGLGLNLAASVGNFRQGRRSFLSILLNSLLIALTRHTGIFLVAGALTAAVATGAFSIKRTTGTLLACAGLVLAWLGLEASQSGMLTGGARPGREIGALSFLSQAIAECTKSFLWIVKDGQPLAVSTGIALLASLLSGFGLKNLADRPNVASHTLFGMGLCYWLAALPMVGLFRFSEGVDQRFLGPGLLLMQVGLLGQIDSKKIWLALAAAGVLALANLPWRGIALLIGL